MAKEFKLYTAINQDAIYQIAKDILKNGSVTKGYILETYDLIDQNALEGSIERNLEDNDLPTVEELSEEQYGVIYSSLENKLDYARILNVEFGKTDAWGKNCDLDITFEYDFEALVESALKEFPNKEEDNEEREV